MDSDKSIAIAVMVLICFITACVLGLKLLWRDKQYKCFEHV